MRIAPWISWRVWGGFALKVGRAKSPPHAGLVLSNTGTGNVASFSD
jgi:hypothetical protein